MHVPTHVPEGENRRVWGVVMLVLTLLAAYLKYEGDRSHGRVLLGELEQAARRNAALHEETRDLTLFLNATAVVGSNALDGSAPVWSGLAPGDSFAATIATVVSLGTSAAAIDAGYVRYTLVERDTASVTVETRCSRRSGDPTTIRTRLVLEAAPAVAPVTTVTTRAGTFACSSRRRTLELEGRPATLEEWRTPRVPLPVRSVLSMPGAKYRVELELEPR